MPLSIAPSLRALRLRLDKNAFYKSVAYVAGGTALVQTITILTTPVVTRLYTPEDFGALGMFMAVLGVLQPVATLTYFMAIPLADDTDQAHDLVRLCFFITGLMTLLLTVVVFFAGERFAAQFSVPEAAPYLWLLPLCLLGSGIYEALSGWALRKKFFKIIARTKLSQGISSVAVKIGLGFLGFQPLGLFLGLLASSIAGCGSIMRKLMQEEPLFFRQYTWKGVRVAARRFSRFPLYRSWSKLLLGLNTRLPVFFIAASFGPEVVGFFTFAYSMISLPMNLVGTALSQVYYAEIAGYGKTQPDKIRSLSISLMIRMAVVGILPTALLMFAGPWMFSLVFGEQWHDAGVFAQFLAFITWGQFVAAPVMSCFDVFELQAVQLGVNLLRLALTVGVFTATQFLGFTPLLTIVAYSAVIGLYLLFMIGLVILLLNQQTARNKTRPDTDCT